MQTPFEQIREHIQNKLNGRFLARYQRDTQGDYIESWWVDAKLILIQNNGGNVEVFSPVGLDKIIQPPPVPRD